MGQAKNRGTFEQRRAAAESAAPVDQQRAARLRRRQRENVVRSSVKVIDPTIRRFIINKPEQAQRLARLYADNYIRRKAIQVSRT